MKLEDMLDISLTSIRHQKLRSWLTILGIVIGVAAIITLISVSLGMEQDINEKTSSFGADVIRVSPGGSRAMRIPGAGLMGGGGGPPPGGSFGADDQEEETITFKEADVLRSLPGVLKLDAQVQGRADVSYKGENSSLNVIGTEPDSFEEMVDTDLSDGRYLNINDRYSAVIGSSLGGMVFDETDMLNKQISIDGVVFRVVGILEKTGSDDMAIYIPQSTGRDLFDQQDDVSQIVVIAREDHDPQVVATRISEELLSLHNLENEDPDFTVTTAASMQEAVSSISDTIGLFLGGIASISLLVGGIGVLNTMFMSVMEQTKTIGVFKALGAKDGEIILLFLLEAGILGLIGGILGIILSLGASFILGSFSVSTLISAELMAGGLIFSVVIGVIAGIFPARNAASISPIEALRYE